MSLVEALEVVAGILQQYGYVALFGVFVIEGAMLLYFAPSESLIPAAVIFLADSTAEIALAIGVAVVGATLGQTLLFLLAQRKGRSFLLNNRLFRVSEDRLERFESWFDRWGSIAVPLSNTMLFVRGMLTVPAGIADMDTSRFVVLSALGTLSFQTILALLTIYAPDMIDVVI